MLVWSYPHEQRKIVPTSTACVSSVGTSFPFRAGEPPWSITVYLLGGSRGLGLDVVAFLVAVLQGERHVRRFDRQRLRVDSHHHTHRAAHPYQVAFLPLDARRKLVADRLKMALPVVDLLDDV